MVELDQLASRVLDVRRILTRDDGRPSGYGRRDCGVDWSRLSLHLGSRVYRGARGGQSNVS